jgi:hypothetical protein
MARIFAHCRMPRSFFHTLSLAAALVIAVGLTYQLRPPAAPTVACNLNQGACRAPLDSGELTLRLSPQPIPLLTPITVEVSLADAQADSVRFELVGAEMDMGLIRSQLTPDGTARFVGTTTIPVCVTGPMRWRADVHVIQSGKVTTRSFNFDTPENATPPASAPRTPG